MRSATHGQMQVGLMPMETYLRYRIIADCPAIEKRAQEIVTDYLKKRDPRSRLLEVQFAWTSDRGIALMIEVKKDGGDWEIGRSLVRVQ